MNWLDWLVLASVLLFIVVYGAWKSRENKNIHSYLLGDKQAGWLTVALSIMATQASAITFLSAPGQAFSDGMRFVQFYFGLPLAMVVLCAVVVPIYHRLQVYTAYEYLEKRFDARARVLAALLFLSQRGLAAGFTIFAPALILSSLFRWDIYLTNILIGSVVIVYTVTGGSKAVNITQKYQMAVILGGMFIAGCMVVYLLPESVRFTDALHLAGKMGKLNAVSFEFDLSDRYNIWSGVIGGFFLSMSYFGTDQSQVQRYLSGSSVAQSRLGLLFNGMVKIPMQFLILFIGAMVYVFFLFYQPPVFFNQVLVEQVQASSQAEDFDRISTVFGEDFARRRTSAENLVTAMRQDNESAIASATQALREADAQLQQSRQAAIGVIKQADPIADTNDVNYVFLNFVLHYLPPGLVGLLIAVILSASMSSTSSELNALASTTIVDIYRRFVKKDGSDAHYVSVSKWATFLWGIYAVVFAMFANRLGTLIEAVNILGSLVYGTILGIFMVAFFIKKIRGTAVFVAAILSEAVVLYCYFYTNIPFLWYNVIGCMAVIGFAWLVQFFYKQS